MSLAGMVRNERWAQLQAHGKPWEHFADDGVVLYHQDCLSLMDFLPDACVDLTITSPPYDLDMPYVGYKDFIGYIKYMDWLQQWGEELLTITADHGRLCLNIPLDTGKVGSYPFYADAVARMQAAGWTYHTSILWNRHNITSRLAWGSWQSPSAPYVRAPIDMIVVFHKGNEWRRGEELTPDIAPESFIEWTYGVWNLAGESPTRYGHPAPFPEEIPRRLVQLYSYKEDIVFDPFAGSGTTLVVARRYGRRSAGVEQDAGYCDIIAKRLAEHF